MDLLSDLKERGLLNDCTDAQALAQHLAEGPITLYCGFDPSADSLHIGSLVPLLALRRFQRAGHKPIALVGGATGLIGDPSFKAQERQLQTDEIISGWVNKLKTQVSQFLDFDDQNNPAQVVSNLDWMQGYSAIRFLRDIGKHFSVNQMIQKESVKQRIEREGSGISYTEFSYMLLQALDFAELNRTEGCTLQLGGSDQWGNITSGIDLTRRLNRQQVFGLTLPLITKADGSKFGKTESGTVWLDAKRTSPYSFYQFWLNTADADVYRFLKYFTFLSVEHIDALEAQDKSQQGKPQAQRLLAEEVTRIVHGEEGLQAAQAITDAMQQSNFGTLRPAELSQLAQDGIECVTPSGDQIRLDQLLVDAQLARTNNGQYTLGQARKLIQARSIEVNGEKVVDPETLLSADQALFGEYHFLKRGKKELRLVCWAARHK